MIEIKHSLGTFCKNENNIIRIEAFSSYSKIYCVDEKYPIIISKVLKWFQEQLSTNEFIRIHRSHLINKNYMAYCLPNNVVMHNGDIINRSRRLKKNTTM